jgi:hypothetical protein
LGISVGVHIRRSLQQNGNIPVIFESSPERSRKVEAAAGAAARFILGGIFT